MRPRSIQFQLTAWYAVVLAAALAVFGGLIWLSLRERLLAELDEDLQESASRFEAYMRRESGQASGAKLKVELEEFSQGLPAALYLDLTGSRGFEFHFPASRRAGLRQARTVETHFAIARENFALQVGSSTRAIGHTLDLLALLLLSLIPAVVALACLGGAWLSRRALRPVDQITAAARAISIENLSQRLPVPATGDEIERLTEVWNTMLARLESAVKTLSQFAADASHELRTPLAVIRTSAELALRRAREPEAYRESLNEIVAEAERMTQLVEDLLFLARTDSRSGGFTMSPLDLRISVRDAISELRDLARERSVTLRLAEPSREVPVHGNATALRRLFLVLLDNALKYSHRGGIVNVVIHADSEKTRVSVEDFGIGIAAEDLPHIFKRFYRADKARASATGPGGYGLGLSLAQTLAEVHGAAIDVTSVEGQGSTFAVVCPVSVAYPGPVIYSRP